MKLYKSTITAAIGMIASPCFAITANNYSNISEFVGDTLNIRISGSTAQDPIVLGTAMSLCTAGSLHRYSISNNFVFYCTPDAGSGSGQVALPARSPAVTKLAIYKYAVGGSAFGVRPIQSTTEASGASISSNGAQLPFLDLSRLAANCTGGSATTSIATFGSPPVGTYVDVRCSQSSSSLTTLATTYIGLSDVEPEFFGAASSFANVNSFPIYSLIFGVPVSYNIYTALQAQQGLASGDAEANMPSLTSGQVSTAYRSVGIPWAALGVAPGLSDGVVYVSRGLSTSGTQKAFEALVARTPNGHPSGKSCSPNSDVFVEPDHGGDALVTGNPESVCGLSSGHPYVTAAASTTAMANCLANHASRGRGAIGMLATTERPQGNNWRFVKIDGAAPNHANVASGRYPYYTEATLNLRAVGGGNVLATASASGYSSFVARLRSDFSNAQQIRAVNGGPQSFGSTGVMAQMFEQSPYPAPDFTGVNTVNPWSKRVGASDLNNCMAPIFNAW